MNRYILIPDSFKGSMTSSEICAIMRSQILIRDPGADVVSIPAADGGEGSVDCFLEALGGTRIETDVCGPFIGESVSASYAILKDGKTAVVEAASCAGLPMVEGRRDPARATTFGLGEQMLDAVGRGVCHIIVGLGGTASNDGGCGAAAAAGVRFYDREGNRFIPTGGTLANIAQTDASRIADIFKSVRITAMCDIDNPMYGESGAAAVFGPQKGADPAMAADLDRGLRHLADILFRDLGADVARLPGGGAAGAMGAGMNAFFGAELRKGIDTVLDAVQFDEIIKGASLVLTGEGRIDVQSLRGKVVVGVARRAKARGTPVIAIVGDIGDGMEAVYAEGVSGIISINRAAMDFQAARRRAPDDLRLTVDNLIRMYQTFTGPRRG